VITRGDIHAGYRWSGQGGHYQVSAAAGKLALDGANCYMASARRRDPLVT